MRTTKLCGLTALVGLLASVVHAGYVQDFETDFEGTYVYGYDGIRGWAFPPNWGTSGGGGYLIDTSLNLPVGEYPTPAVGSRYIMINGNDPSNAGGSYYNLLNLMPGNPGLVMETKQTVAFDFYLDNATAFYQANPATGSSSIVFQLRGNINTPYYGNNYWGYLKNIEIDYNAANQVWVFKHAGSGGNLITGPSLAPGSWHHLEYQFDFSVQNGMGTGAKMNLVLDGTALQSNSIVDYWGADVDPAQFSTADNPFRIYWYANQGAVYFVDNFMYVPTQCSLTATVTPAGYNGTGADLGIVGVKVQLLNPGTSTVIQTYKVLLSDTGTFNIPSVPKGAYDVTIQGPGWLRTKIPSFPIYDPVNSLGSITLQYGGDANGDNQITSSDLAIVLANMDQAGN